MRNATPIGRVWPFLVLLGLLLASCGGDAAAPPAPEEPATEAREEEPEEAEEPDEEGPLVYTGGEADVAFTGDVRSEDRFELRLAGWIDPQGTVWLAYEGEATEQGSTTFSISGDLQEGSAASSDGLSVSFSHSGMRFESTDGECTVTVSRAEPEGLEGAAECGPIESQPFPGAVADEGTIEATVRFTATPAAEGTFVYTTGEAVLEASGEGGVEQEEALDLHMGVIEPPGGVIMLTYTAGTSWLEPSAYVRISGRSFKGSADASKRLLVNVWSGEPIVGMSAGGGFGGEDDCSVTLIELSPEVLEGTVECTAGSREGWTYRDDQVAPETATATFTASA